MRKTKTLLIISTLFGLCLVCSGCDSEALKKQFQGKFGNIGNIGKRGAKSRTSKDKQGTKNSRLEQLRKGTSKKYYKNEPGKLSKSSSRITRIRRNESKTIEPVKERMFGFDEDQQKKKRKLSRVESRRARRTR